MAPAPRFSSSGAGLEERGVENRPKMDEPPEENEPEHSRETKLNDRNQESTCSSCPSPGMKKLQSAAMTLPAEP